MASNSGKSKSPQPPQIGIGGPSLQIRLLRAEAVGEPTRPASADPFVDVSPLDVPYRTYLAQVFIGSEPDPRPVSVYLEPNEYPEGRATPQGYWNHRQLDAVWDSAYETATKLGPEQMVPLASYMRSAADSSSAAPFHPPVAFCREANRYAEVVCPSCLGSMSTCRDDAVLQTSGLPVYTQGLERFLHCSACTKDPSRSTIFYTYSKQRTFATPDGVEVRYREELYSDLAGRVHSKDPALASHGCFVCKLASDERSVDEPTQSCANGSTLFALSYYESRHWVRETAHFSFEETASLLGGASLAPLLQLRPKRQALAEHPGGAALVKALGPERSQFFFAGDRTGLFSVEVLQLKLSTMVSLLRAAIGVYETGRPCLGLSPAKLRGVHRTGAAGLPARWGLEMAFADALSTAPLQMTPPAAIPLHPWVIPEPRVSTFLPPEMHRTQSQSANMRIDLETLEVHGGGDRCQLALTATLVSDVYRDSDHGEHDLVRIQLNSPTSGQRLTFDGQRTQSTANGFQFQGISAPLPEAEAMALRDVKELGARSVDVTLFHTYGGPTDLYGLALLSLRLLFWNDRQTGNQIDAEPLKRAAARIAETHGNATVLDWEELSLILEDESIESGSEEILYREEDRAGANAIPSSLWSEVWMSLLRMVSNIPGWSYAVGLDDYPSENPARPISNALADLEALEEQARGAMMGSSGRNSLVLEVCQDFLDDLREAASPSATPNEDNSEMTMVVQPQRPK